MYPPAGGTWYFTVLRSFSLSLSSLQIMKSYLRVRCKLSVHLQRSKCLCSSYYPPMLTLRTWSRRDVQELGRSICKKSFSKKQFILSPGLKHKENFDILNQVQGTGSVKPRENAKNILKKRLLYSFAVILKIYSSYYARIQIELLKGKCFYSTETSFHLLINQITYQTLVIERHLKAMPFQHNPD